jgi:hypothetical protein
MNTLFNGKGRKSRNKRTAEKGIALIKDEVYKVSRLG